MSTTFPIGPALPSQQLARIAALPLKPALVELSGQRVRQIFGRYAIHQYRERHDCLLRQRAQHTLRFRSRLLELTLRYRVRNYTCARSQREHVAA